MSAVSAYLHTPGRLRRAAKKRKLPDPEAPATATPPLHESTADAIIGYWTVPITDPFGKVTRASVRILEGYTVGDAVMPTEVVEGQYLPVLPVLQRFEHFLPIFPWLREEVISWAEECGMQVYLSPEHPYHLPALESLHDCLLRHGWSWEIDEQTCRLNETARPPGHALHEVSFRRLMQYTAANGLYKVGGMRKIMGQWVYDPAVSGRLENSRFIITNPPQLRLSKDGYPQIQFSFKARADRSTTGMRQRGYVKIIPTDKRAKYEFGQKVEVFCSCPDFKFRWHKVLADMGASHTPSGIGGEASNQDPMITNPSHLPSLCKHLVAVGAYLQKSSRDYDRQLKGLRKKAPAVKPTAPGKPPVVKTGAEVTDQASAQDSDPEGSLEGEGTPLSTNDEPQGEDDSAS